MIVTPDTFNEVLAKLLTEKYIALDTETTGLRRFHGDRLFSVAIAFGEQSFYFNFNNHYPECDRVPFLPRRLIPAFQPLLKDRLIFGHNLKFDLHMLAAEGLDVYQGEYHDTMITARLLKNTEMSYSLDNCAKRIGKEKDHVVEEFIKKKKLYSVEVIPGKKTRFKSMHFDLVPFDLIAPYAEKDARLAFELGTLQLAEIRKLQEATPERIKGINEVYENERKLLKVFLKIEEEGMVLDRPYIEEAITHEEIKAKEIKSKIEVEIGKDFVDSNKQLLGYFGTSTKFTEKGNASFDDDALSRLGTPLAKRILEYRDTQKRINTYFKSFKFHCSRDGKVHCDLKQSAAETGRISIKDPPLQTLSKRADKGSLYPIRRSFIPEPGTFFLELDYKFMEFALMLDRAGELALIKKIEQGHDPHQATAEMSGVTREEAKTLNFMLLYGGGAAKLAASLGISLDAATAMKKKYFQALPNVQRFMWRVMDTAKLRGFVFNFVGRRFYFPDPKWAYKAPNAIIQGSGADICKIAMLNCDRILSGYKSKLILQIHDALVFKMYPDEMDIIPLLKNAMESAYPYKYLPLTVDMKHSFKSWWDLEDGLPGKETRNEVQREGVGIPEETPQLLC